MRVEKKLEKRKSIKKIITLKYCLKSKKQKCSKVGYRVIKRRQQDRAKKKYKKYKNQKNIKGKILGW